MLMSAELEATHQFTDHLSRSVATVLNAVLLSSSITLKLSNAPHLRSFID